MTPAPEWLPVPDAASAAGVPVRSLYRWTEKKRVPTRQERGTTLVDVAAVRAYAARRAAFKETGPRAGTAGTNADTAPAIVPVRRDGTGSGMQETRASGTPPSATRQAPTASGNAGSTTTDADLAAEVFTRFEEGDTPVDVVREMRLSPDRVRSLHREWMELRALGGGGGPSVAERLAELERQLKELMERLPFEMMGVEINANAAIGRLDGRIDALELRLAGPPVLPPGFNFGPRR
jgi:hypothetical protein